MMPTGKPLTPAIEHWCELQGPLEEPMHALLGAQGELFGLHFGRPSEIANKREIAPPTPLLAWMNTYQKADWDKLAHMAPPLNLDALPASPFARQVWALVMQTRPGQTLHYQALAQQLGKSDASRAVGRAVGANPLALLVPCHRVLPKQKPPGGYRWGALLKTRLLQFEQQAK